MNDFLFFHKDLIDNYEKIKNKIYTEYGNNNITLKEREVLLNHAKNKIFKNIYITEDENDSIDFSITQKRIKCITKIEMFKKLINEKSEMIEKSIKNIDKDKSSDVYFIFLNRNNEIDSVIKILDYFYKFIKDPSNNSENYNHIKEELINDINESSKNVKINSYSINEYSNKFKIDFNFSQIIEYKNKYSLAFNESYLDNILNKNNENKNIIKNAYSDFYTWFVFLLGYKNYYYNQMCKCVKIAEIYQNKLYEDFNNNKNSYNDLLNSSPLLQKLFQSVYKEYYDILNSDITY